MSFLVLKAGAVDAQKYTPGDQRSIRQTVLAAIIYIPCPTLKTRSDSATPTVDFSTAQLASDMELDRLVLTWGNGPKNLINGNSGNKHADGRQCIIDLTIFLNLFRFS